MSFARKLLGDTDRQHTFRKQESWIHQKSKHKVPVRVENVLVHVGSRETVHRDAWPSRVVFVSMFGSVVMVSSSPYHAVCAPVSQRYVRCLMFRSPLLG